MKAITEDFLRVELRNTQPEVYYIPEGKILTPAAREYLQQRKIKVAAGGQPAEPAPAAAPAAQPVVPTAAAATAGTAAGMFSEQRAAATISLEEWEDKKATP